MEFSFGSRLKRAWNIFMNRYPTNDFRYDIGAANYYRPDRPILTRGSERTIINSIYNRIALDVAAVDIRHVRLDEEDRYVSTIDSTLNSCLTLEANIDQSGRELIKDVVLSMFDEGCVAIVPVDTDTDPEKGSYDILSLRTGKIVEWYPRHIKVEVYNDRTGAREQIIVSKRTTAIVENPFYAVMNAPNSTMQRLMRKLTLLDILDEKTGQGKLDLIIQLPYVIKAEAKRQQAENRRKDIERQLAGSKYGIAYIDGTEHITQLNRPAENNLMAQIEYLTNMAYSQLGITVEILNGTANEETMLNYQSRIIRPIVLALVESMKRTFLTKTARTQKQSIEFFKDPFDLVPVSNIAEIADKFTRNEIMTSNEIRQIIGMKPSSDPNADVLRNKNLNASADQVPVTEEGLETENLSEEEMIDEEAGGEGQVLLSFEQFREALADIDEVDKQLDELEAEVSEGDEDIDDDLKHYASPYYDPVKAHEYYERTKKFKGRKSTAELNDAGKAAAKYVKEKITAEKKAKIQESKNLTDAARKKKQAEKSSTLKSSSEKLKADVKKLREAYSAATKGKKLSKEERAKIKEKVDAKVASLRAKNKADREKLAVEYKAYSSKLSELHKSNREKYTAEAEEKYEAELEKTRNESSFKKVTKKRK